MSERIDRIFKRLRRRWRIRTTEGASPVPDLSSGSSSAGLSDTANTPSSDLIVQSSDSVEPSPCSRDHAHSPATSNHSENTARSNLWDLAFERLRHDNHELVEAYEHMLKEGINMPEGASHNEKMRAVINQRFEEMKSKQWNVPGTTIRIREQIDRIVKIVMKIRDVGAAVVALDPVHAAPAWAGVCVLLSTSKKSNMPDKSFQLVVNNSEAREKATADIENVAVLIPRYKQVEKVYLESATLENEHEPSVKSHLHQSVVDLYSNILTYQIELARYLQRGSFILIVQDVLQLNEFGGLMQKIKDSDKKCQDWMEVYDATLADHNRDKLRIQITQLDDRINQLIADITSSRSVVEWNPGPNTDPGYVSVLYGGFRGRAGFFRISLADIESDKQLYLQMRAAYAKRQHRLWRIDLPHPWKSLAWLSWFDVKRLEFVKVA
ncbi:hypothetical protein Asppvi_003770 [Aspergillus pseudoviridinutans]|uniref:NWD NACHT-NTPase N-terminal domain-containing protein n=1 Tax=Aspergillus pseudoviridinutans TaxID=1517512 RepID=A0A9P3B7M9_9EURO|nr:uncharacterized protein Asppvi_003770 [Aspergillus pseudoviridinutans]GIJ84919.1 hypothetical protein Asppvi_003770 [Aspergillus pseudoviridinutans]